MTTLNAAGSPVLPTQMISQDMFPGCYIEPAWSRLDKMKKAPMYAVRLALGARTTKCPNGYSGFTSLTFEDKEFILADGNLELVRFLEGLLVNDYFPARGIVSSDFFNYHHLRFNPEVIMDAITFASEQCIQLLDIPLEKSKMIWILPDNGPCGYYRSTLPGHYMEQHHRTTMYCERAEFMSFGSVAWFDAVIMHRCPPRQLLATFQNLKLAGKVMIFEFDDDIFSVPEWNHNAANFNQEALDRARACIDMADIIIGSTEELVQVSGRPEVGYHGPNLIDMDVIGEPLKCDRKLQEEFFGYAPQLRNGVISYRSHAGPFLKQEAVTEENYHPIRILWTGSNTHDNDLHHVEEAVIQIVKKYGISVQFFFFGYCPARFLEVRIESGNTNQRMVVKDEYKHAIQYLPPMALKHYYEMIRKISPDFAICPLTEHSFNLSKSNLKILELGAFGIPSIASDVGPYRFIGHLDDGMKVPQFDGKPSKQETMLWVDYIETLIKNDGLRRKLSRSILQDVESNFSWQVDSENRRKWDTIFQVIHEKSQQRHVKQLELL